MRSAAAEGAAEGFMAVTDHQTDGRGRRGRTWADEPGASLMFSLLLRPDAPTEALAPLALVVGVGIAEALPIAGPHPVAQRHRHRRREGGRHPDGARDARRPAAAT